MTIDELTKQLLAHMGMDEAQVGIEETDEKIQLTIQVSEDDSGILIGRHGETIDSLQRILRFFTHDSEKQLIVNINDFRERREEHLKEVALAVADRVISTGNSQTLHLSPAERRVIHMVLSENTSVETHSEGDGEARVLIVSPKMEVAQ